MQHESTVSHAGSTDPQLVSPEAASASESPTIQPAPPDREAAKRYSRIKIAVGIIGAVFFFAFTLAILSTGASTYVEWLARRVSSNDYVVLLLFGGILSLAESLLMLPLKYYSGYYIEHTFRLSNQSLGAWVWEGVKGMLVGIPILTPIALAFYYCLRTLESLWWLPVGAILFLVSVVARLAPVFIFPLFHKFKPLEEGPLQKKILDLCMAVGITVEGIFVFDMSKNTKKANAAFTGIGKSRRIILGDTLIANFTDEEIETVFAHELGHYKLKHVWRMMVVGTVNSFLGLYLTAVLYEWSLGWFGFTGIDTIAALPLLTVWLGLYSLVTGPIANGISRSHERAADRYAIATTGNKQAFINSLKKLAAINLADAQPHPLVEFLFHSHPSIEKRIRAVEQFQ